MNITSNKSRKYKINIYDYQSGKPYGTKGTDFSSMKILYALRFKLVFPIETDVKRFEILKIVVISFAEKMHC